jgi:hypothetical protein
MGVPISFLDKYCPEQFEILGSSESGGKNLPEIKKIWTIPFGKKQTSGFIKGKAKFKRIFIKRRKS